MIQMGAAAEVIRKGRKYDQVLDGARQVFLSQGFEGASVDDIARAAHVSKATLYSYFPDKRLLFLEVARTECCRQADEAVANMSDEMRPEMALHIAARTLIDFFTSDFGLRLFRVFVAESERFPELGRSFYDSGPGLAQSQLVEYLKGGVEKGHFVIDDLTLAADQFCELCKADLFPKMIFGLMTKPTTAEKERVIRGAIDIFMARYGRR
jgi:AcrR family transcriptional regulator